MSRTVTAFFDNRAEAEAARTRLSESSIEADRIRIVDQNEAGFGTGSGSEGQGIWASIKSAFIPPADSHAYEEGIRRGGYLLCAEVDEDQADRACSILEETDSVDFDSRQDEWRNQGWSGYSGEADSGFAERRSETGGVVEEERIPLVEEELRVGKREVARGGARVRSYVSETPVREQVDLREEHVSVERRPVDQPLGRDAFDRDSDLLRERTVEMTERSEEAVVGKEARVREEVVLKKTAEERTEQIDDSVRRTEVEVDESGAGTRPAFGGLAGERASEQQQPQSSFDREELRRERESSGFDRSNQ
jgi:uncharacterized protein (TIGR02271 family)